MALPDQDKIATTLSFDKDLMSTDPFDPFGLLRPIIPEKAVREWVEKGDVRTKSKAAITALSDMLIANADRVLTPEGKNRILVIARNLNRFEGLIEHIRTAFAGKIYRDHLNHMIRTTLLSIRLAELVGLSFDNYWKVASAGLFHDAAYPVQEAGAIFEQVADALGEGYSLPRFQEHSQLYNRPSCLSELAERVNIDDATLMEYIVKAANHAVIGAFEFLECCTPKLKKQRAKKPPKLPSDAFDIAAAICLHGLDKEFEFVRNPLAGILVIADELQDWGRPVAEPDGNKPIPLAKIEDFLEKSRHLLPSNIGLNEHHPRWDPWDKLAVYEFVQICWARPEKWVEFAELKKEFEKENRILQPALIAGKMHYDEPAFPLLEVIAAKFQNLKRVLLNEFPLDFRLEFTLGNRFLADPGQIAYLYDPETTNVSVLPKPDKKPWKVDTALLSNEEVHDITGLELEEVETARSMLASSRSMKKVQETLDNRSVPDLFLRCGSSRNYLITCDSPKSMAIVRDYSERSNFLVEIESETTISQGHLFQVNRIPDRVRQPDVYRPLQVIQRLRDLCAENWEPIFHPAEFFWFECKRRIR